MGAEFHGELRTALVPELTVVSADLNATRSFDLFAKSHTIRFLVSGVPVWVKLKFTLEAEVVYDLSATATMSTGVRQNVDVTFGVDYVKNRSPKLQWNPSVNCYPLEIVPFTYYINGSATASATLTPQIDLRVYSLAGVYANVDPTVEINGQATVVNNQVTSANWNFTANADLNIGMSVIGQDNENLPALPPFNLFHKEWSSVYPPPGQLTIRTQPRRSQEVVVGSSASFSVDASSAQPISYQWYNNGAQMNGKTASTLTLNNVNLYHTGDYSVKLTSGGQTLWSSTATLTVRTPSTPAGLVWIPAGSFTMGSPTSEALRGSGETQHTVTLTKGFYLGKYEVTQGEYLGVVGSNPSYFPGDLMRPVEQVSWNDATNYCGLLTQADRAAGRIPSNWRYRLPTEAEWEYACRAGTTTAFHFGSAIHGGMANFYSYYEYDAAIGNIYVASPVGYLGRTTTVGSYAVNAFGLYDMHGNVWEWCQDWSGTYPGGSVVDPGGPDSGSYRVLRGGGWGLDGYGCRSACPGDGNPAYRGRVVGFRVVLASGQ
ncbi:MAG: SUMF1/EgtB/PvdO family nonheme iron enzyme [Verrucomicrobia bacterium]|nr:SUMF1/EgtB/PvdO family nonheme iron enzyme [Verrucomicrobiota bacterium]